MIGLDDQEERAVVLYSGGLDSTTVLHMAMDNGYDPYPISFDYKQRHAVELTFAKKCLEKLGLLGRWKVFKLDFSKVKSSALTDSSMEIPKGRHPGEMGDAIPVSYVPLRNTIFLSYAAAYAESLGINHVFIGVNCLDYSGYPDCRPEFIETIEKALSLGSRHADNPGSSFHLHAPLLHLTKSEIIRKGRELGVNYDLTWSCYDPVVEDGMVKPCGACDSCVLRHEAFDALDA